ncbi:MAG: DUF3305 domain-containing protein [Candidatus Thiodiazotropha sp. L084R]
MPTLQKEFSSAIPQEFAISVVIQQSPSSNIWESQQWEVVGILASKREDATESKVELIHQDGEVYRYLHSGFTLRLHLDECESYYHNLLSTDPCCYVVTTLSHDGSPTPFLVSFSFDEAHAYLEGDETVYAVAVPAEIYRWAEAFVLTHYVPTKRIKRKRADWKNSSERPHES